MLSALIPNFTFTSWSEMLLFLCSIIFATAAGVTAFLLLSSSSIKDFKKRFFPKSRTTQLPIVTEDGKFVDSKEELEAHLEVLETKLMEKVSEIEMSKNRVQDARQSIERLNSTQFQVKKYYIKLREEIKKSEDDCRSLQEQIDDYRKRRAELDQEMKKNENYYKSLLNAVQSKNSLNSSQASSKMSMSSASSSSSSFYDSSSYVLVDDKPVCQRTKTLPPTSDTSESETASQENEENVEETVNLAPVSRVASKCNLDDETVQGSLKKPSNSSLESQKEVSRDAPKRSPVRQRRASPGLVKKTSETSLKSQKEASKDAPKRNASDLKNMSQYLQRKSSHTSLENHKEVSKDSTKHDLELKGSKTGLLPSQLSGCGFQKLKVKSLKGEICCCGCSKCPGTCNIARCIKLGFLKPKDILTVEVADHVDVLTGKIICSKQCTHKVKPLEMPSKKPLSPRNASRFS